VFGKRSSNGPEQRGPAEALPPVPAALEVPSKGIEVGRAPLPSAGLGAPIMAPPLAPDGRNSVAMPAPTATDARRSESYYETKGTIFSALIEAIDLAQLARLDAESAREEIRDIVNEIIAIKNIVMSIAEQEDLLDDICNDVLGYGPLEPLLARDEIADIERLRHGLYRSGRQNSEDRHPVSR
jgi:pilus assembly protein CpaF